MGARPGARKQQRQPGRRSPAARAKTSRQHDQAGRCYRSFRGLLTHLATLTRNQVRFATATIATLAEPTSIQREAFDLTHGPRRAPPTCGTERVGDAYALVTRMYLRAVMRCR